MSPLWRDQVRIVLAPQRVALVRLARGLRPRPTATRVVACPDAAPGDAPWRRALAALESALPEFGERPANAVVILSNHFVRYALVPNSEQIGTAAEEQALMRHSFARVYGDAVERWALRLSDADGAGLRVASAIDQELRESLRALLAATRLKLGSIQPGLMTAFNQWRRRVAGSAWLAVVEPGRLCLARLQDKRWQSLKALAIGDDWFGDLAVQLDRESLLTGPAAADVTAPVPVLVYAPGCSEPSPTQLEARSMQLLRTLPRAGDPEPVDAAYALAGLG